MFCGGSFHRVGDYNTPIFDFHDPAGFFLLASWCVFCLRPGSFKLPTDVQLKQLLLIKANLIQFNAETVETRFLGDDIIF